MTSYTYFFCFFEGAPGAPGESPRTQGRAGGRRATQPALDTTPSNSKLKLTADAYGLSKRGELNSSTASIGGSYPSEPDSVAHPKGPRGTLGTKRGDQKKTKKTL